MIEDSYYRLEKGQPVRCPPGDPERLRQQAGDDWVFAKTAIEGPNWVLEVSTIFLGMDHNWSGDTPMLFETLVLKSDLCELTGQRYSTREEADTGHAKHVVLVREAAERHSRNLRTDEE